MKIFSKLISACDELIKIITSIFFLIILLIGVYALYDAYCVYNGAELSEDIIELKPQSDNANFSVSSLKEINNDICGWIRIDNTNIDYPIVIGKNNSEYLNKDYKGDYATAGSIFLDYRNDKDFKNDYSIIYGHNMQANLMFSSVKKFIEKDFFDTHTSGELYTEDGIYDIEIVCVSKVSAYEGKVYYLELYSQGYNDKILKLFLENSIQKRNTDLTSKNKLLLLSTCDAAGSNNRVVLLTKLTLKKNVAAEELINNGDNTSLKILDKRMSDNPSNEKLFIPSANTEPNSRIEISLRQWIFIVLLVVVIIIFIILIVRIIKLKKKEGNG